MELAVLLGVMRIAVVLIRRWLCVIQRQTSSRETPMYGSELVLVLVLERERC